ncbi:hypothetical protein MTO96_018940 [Rhipicephalus appendiculatus]
MAPGAGTRPRMGHRPEPRMRAGCSPWGAGFPTSPYSSKNANRQSSGPTNRTPRAPSKGDGERTTFQRGKQKRNEEFTTEGATWREERLQSEGEGSKREQTHFY